MSGFCVQSLFYLLVYSVQTCDAVVMLKRELGAIFYFLILIYFCLFLTVLWVGLWSLSVTFPEQIHLAESS